MQLANIYIANLDRDRTPYEECFPWQPLWDEARIARDEKTIASGAAEPSLSLEYLTELLDPSGAATFQDDDVLAARSICAQGQFDRPEDLSVAVEFKFLVPYRPHGAVETDDSRRHPPVATAEMISDAATATDADRRRLQGHAFGAIAATIRACDGEDAISALEIPPHQPLSAYWATHWLVKRSNSAEPAAAHPHYGDWLWVPVEINSPKLSWVAAGGADSSSSSSTSSTTAQRRIRSVLRALHARHRVETNYSCEVHVHVGRRDGRRLGLPSLQRLAALCWLAEPVLRGVKDPRSPNFVHKYTWSSPLRERSRLASELRKQQQQQQQQHQPSQPQSQQPQWQWQQRRPTSELLRAAIRRIFASRSHVELGRLMTGEGRPYRRLGFNFYSLIKETLSDADRTELETVECRFLEGTMAEDVILGWLQIFGRLVQSALVSGEAEERRPGLIPPLLGLLEQTGQCPTTTATFVSLMEGLGIDKSSFAPVLAMVLRARTVSTGVDNLLATDDSALRRRI